MYRNNKTVTVEPTPLDLADYLLGRIRGSELMPMNEHQRRKFKIRCGSSEDGLCAERVQSLMHDHFKRLTTCKPSTKLLNSLNGDFTWLGHRYFVTLNVMSYEGIIDGAIRPLGCNHILDTKWD